MVLTHFLTRPLGNGCGCRDCRNVERTDAEGVTAPTQTPSAPMRSEEGHRVGASRRARLSRDGRTPTRRRPSRREVRACGASLRKRPHRPGVAQAVADGVNSPRGLLQRDPSLSSVGGLVEEAVEKINRLTVRTCGESRRALSFAQHRGTNAFPFSPNNGREQEAENSQHF